MKFLEKLLAKKVDHIGLDIGSNSIKLVQIIPSRGEGAYPVEAYGKIDLPHNALVDGVIKDEAAIISALIQVKSELGIRDEATVNISVSGRHVSTRTIKLPVMPLDELGMAVNFEAEKHISTPLEQLYYDYTILGEIIEEYSQYNILLAAAPRTMIDAICRVVEGAGLANYGVEIESLAIYRMWHNYFYDQDLANQVIINLGHHASNLVAFQGDNIQFTRSMPVAGQHMTEAIMAANDVDYESARIYKHNYVIGENTELDPFLASLADEIRRSIDFYQMQAKVRLDRIIITGGNANMAGLDYYLEGELNLPVLVGQYDTLNPCYSLASGLALRDQMRI